MRQILLILLLSSLPGMVRAEPELRGTPADLAGYLAELPRPVLLAGEAELKVPSDRASVSLRVTTENRSLEESLKRNEDLRRRITEHLAKQGISADRVQASKFASTAKYGLFSERAKTHQIEYTLKVSVLTEKEFQKVAGAVDAFPETAYLGVEFERSDKEELKAQAVQQACEKVNRRRKLYEEQFNVSLTPRSFAESIGPDGTVLAAGEMAKFEDRKMDRYGVTPLSASSASTVSESVTAFGEIVIAARLTVEFSLKPK